MRHYVQKNLRIFRVLAKDKVFLWCYLFSLISVFVGVFSDFYMQVMLAFAFLVNFSVSWFFVFRCYGS